MENNNECPKCHGTGIVKDEKDHSTHTCWDCLRNGDMDQHSKDLKDSKIKL